MDALRARAVLQVPLGSSPSEIERAFRHRARHAHPDHGGDPDEFRALVQARAVLRRAATRRPAPVIVVPDEPWWQPLTRLWHRRKQPTPTRRVA